MDLDSFMWKLRFWPVTYSLAQSTPHWQSQQWEILDSTAFRYLLMGKAHGGFRPQCSSFTHLSCFSSALGEEMLRIGVGEDSLSTRAASKLMLPRKKRVFFFKTLLGQPETKITVMISSSIPRWSECKHFTCRVFRVSFAPIVYLLLGQSEQKMGGFLNNF